MSMKVDVEELKSKLVDISEIAELDKNKAYLIVLKPILPRKQIHEIALQLNELGKDIGVKLIISCGDIIDKVYEVTPENEEINW